jgi:hypothetical protein
MNRWQALVEVVRILAKSNRPGLAFAAVFIMSGSLALVLVMLTYIFW